MITIEWHLKLTYEKSMTNFPLGYKPPGVYALQDKTKLSTSTCMQDAVYKKE